MEQELYFLIKWPEVQALMMKPGFDDNSHLMNDQINAFPAYFVRKEWYDEVNYKDYVKSMNQ